MNIAVVIVFPFRALSALIYCVNHTIKNRNCHYTCDIKMDNVCLLVTIHGIYMAMTPLLS